MTLLELATFITTKLNQSEAEDVAACKTFLQRRFEMIWTDQLWKDSLFEYTQSLSATGYDVNSTWMPTKQTLLLPTQFSHVVAARTAIQKMNVVSAEQLYRIDYDTFAATGNPIQYRLLKPCVWEFDVTENIIANGHGADPGSTITVDYLASDGVTLSNGSGDLSDLVNILGVLRIDKVSKPVTSVALQLLDAGGNGTQFLSMAAADTKIDKRCRIQLFGTVPDPTTIRILGKTKPPQFTEDADEPSLTGVENCLIAFAQADMLERERQYGKAQAVMQEGAALLAQLKKVETVQQSFHQRFIPEQGYGDDNWQGNTSPLSF